MNQGKGYKTDGAHRWLVASFSDTNGREQLFLFRTYKAALDFQTARNTNKNNIRYSAPRRVTWGPGESREE